jgi:hypothetical protein
MKGINHVARTTDNYLKLFGAGLLLLMLGMTVGCGEDSFTGEPTGTTSSTTPTQTTNPTTGASVATIQLLTSTPSLGSSPTDSVDISAIVKDTNNNLMSDIDVIFSSNGGDLTVTQSSTSATGVAAANLTTASDPSNRTITVTATAGNISNSIQVAVTGTEISISGATTLVLGDTTSLTIFVRDSDGQGLTGQILDVSAQANNLSAATVTTNSSGQATVDVTGVIGGQDTITVTGLGTSASFTIDVSGDQFTFSEPAANDLDIGTTHTISVNWSQNATAQAGETVYFSATRGTLSANSAVTDASGDATITITSNNAGPSVITATTTATGPSASITREFVATTPQSLTIQADRTTVGPNGEQAALTAIVRDTDNNLVKNINIRFAILQDNSGGSISNSTDVTDSQGRATTIYTSTSATTAKDGVQIRASVDGVDCGALPDQCDTVNLTVAQNELFVVLGTGNKISQYQEILYKYPYTVLVTDAGGNAVENTDVVITMIPTLYRTGYLSWSDTFSQWYMNVNDTCVNEDANLDGVLDTGEDINNNAVLDPRNVASVAGTVTTDAEGLAKLEIVYAKEYALWVDVQLTATAGVAGTESLDSVQFTLPVLVDDMKSEDSPPSSTSPWGAASTCAAVVTGVPFNVAATPDADQAVSTILVVWNGVSGATGYNVYRDTTANFTPDTAGGTNRIADNVTQGVYFDTNGGGGLTPATTYYYQITADIVGTGEGTPSNEASAIAP